MKRFIVTCFLLLALTTSSTLVPTTHAGGIGVVATEFTQLLNNIQLMQQTLTQVQQLQTQFQQYQTMLQNSVNVPNQVFSNISGDLNRMATVVNNGQGLAYSMANLDEQFKLTYPGYNPQSQVPLPQQYKNWNQSTLDTIQSSLRAAGLRGSQLQDEQSVLSALRQMSQSNTGAMQAAQTGNQIATEQVAQLQKLQALMLADMQSKQAYFALQTQNQMANDSVRQQTFSNPVTVVGSGKSY